MSFVHKILLKFVAICKKLIRMRNSDFLNGQQRVRKKWYMELQKSSTFCELPNKQLSFASVGRTSLTFDCELKFQNVLQEDQT